MQSEQWYQGFTKRLFWSKSSENEWVGDNEMRRICELQCSRRSTATTHHFRQLQRVRIITVKGNTLLSLTHWRTHAFVVHRLNAIKTESNCWLVKDLSLTFESVGPQEPKTCGYNDSAPFGLQQGQKMLVWLLVSIVQTLTFIILPCFIPISFAFPPFLSFRYTCAITNACLGLWVYRSWCWLR